MRSRSLVTDLIPYIASAAVLAFALGYCTQPFASSIKAAVRTGAQDETTQPVDPVDRTHKGDRLSGWQPGGGQIAGGNASIGIKEPPPNQVGPGDPPTGNKFKSQLREECGPGFGPVVKIQQGKFVGRCLV